MAECPCGCDKKCDGWDQLVTALLSQGLKDLVPGPPTPLVWPNPEYTQDQAMVAYTLHTQRLLIEDLQLRIRDMETAVGQAVEIAEYVEGHAKGRMVERVQEFLSLPFSQYVAQKLHKTIGST